MCLITEQKKAIRTKEDMIVWKVMFGNTTAYMNFEYEEGRLYKPRIRKDYSGVCWADMEARKAYPHRVALLVAFRDRDTAAWKQSGFISIGPGFHSCETEERARKMLSGHDENIRQFLIPAGSLIYKDRTGLIVSNQIMMLPKENL